MLQIVFTFLGAILAGPAGFIAGIRHFKKNYPKNNPKAPMCTCGHGYGAHDDQGCHMQTVQNIRNKEVVKDQSGRPIKDCYGDVQTVESITVDKTPCGCRRYDGEIPAHLIGMDLLR